MGIQLTGLTHGRSVNDRHQLFDVVQKDLVKQGSIPIVDGHNRNVLIKIRRSGPNIFQDALGLLLPATAEPEGYTAEKAKGNIKVLPPGGEFRFSLETGALSPAEAKEMEAKINQIKES